MYGCTGDMLSSLCSAAQHLVIAAPYIKADALVRILGEASSAPSLTCVTRWSPHDLAVGASDAECRTIVIERGGLFMLHPSLHAKYYRIDDDVLVGSANLTASAMGWSTQPNLEILCPAGDDFDTRDFERKLLQDAREISDDEFARWETIAKIDRLSEHNIRNIQPQLDTWRPLTRDPRHLELAYRGQEDDIASSDEQLAAVHDIQSLLIPPDLTDEHVRIWASTCLLAAPFANAVIQLHTTEKQNPARILANAYGLSITQARRDMETVHNWLAHLAPETLHRAG